MKKKTILYVIMYCGFLVKNREPANYVKFKRKIRYLHNLQKNVLITEAKATVVNWRKSSNFDLKHAVFSFCSNRFLLRATNTVVRTRENFSLLIHHTRGRPQRTWTRIFFFLAKTRLKRVFSRYSFLIIGTVHLWRRNATQYVI